jgi:hypothetical protein
MWNEDGEFPPHPASVVILLGEHARARSVISREPRERAPHSGKAFVVIQHALSERNTPGECCTQLWGGGPSLLNSIIVRNHPNDFSAALLLLTGSFITEFMSKLMPKWGV